MIRRHPWRTVAVAVVLLAPAGAWLAAFEVWWVYQGRKRFGR